MFDHGGTTVLAPTTGDLEVLRNLYGQGGVGTASAEQDDDENGVSEHAERIAPAGLNGVFPRFEVSGTIAGAADVDTYIFRASDVTSESPELTTIILRTESPALVARVSLATVSGQKVEATVIANGHGMFVLQSRDIEADEDYVISVQPTGSDPRLSQAKYELAVTFSESAPMIERLAKGTLDRENPQQMFDLYSAKSQLFNFQLATTDSKRRPSAAVVAMSVCNQTGQRIFHAAAKSGDIVTDNTVLLGEGKYVIIVEAVATTTRSLPEIEFQVRGSIVSHDAGPLPRDPTGNPAGGGGGNLPYVYPNNLTSSRPFNVQRPATPVILFPQYAPVTWPLLPSNWSASPGYAVQQTVDVIAGEKTNNVDFANFTVLNGSIRGSVWNDVNRDGVRNSSPSGVFSDPGLAGWTVYLDMNRSGAFDTGEPTALTEVNGAYVFPDLQIGDYDVIEIVPTGWETAPTFGDNYTATVFSGAETVAHDFANFNLSTLVPGSVSGTVWNDQNGNGVLDTTPTAEPGLGGRVVFADVNANGILDATDLQTTTNADGTYTISGIAPGTISIYDVVPSGWRATSPVTGVRSLVLKNGENATGVNYGNAERKNSTMSGNVFADTNKFEQSVTMLAAENHSGVDFADVFRLNEIHGVKFDDTNGNHVRDPGEIGVGGTTIFIDSNRNDALDSGETSTLILSDGSYSFTGLTPGAYVVREVLETGFSHSYPTTTGGTLWPAGTSNPAQGNVRPAGITTSLAVGQSFHQTVSLTLPGTGSLTNAVDVFLLFDDTGSFVNNSPIVRAAFPNIITQLQMSLSGTDLAFGVGRFEEYANFASEYSTGRPFILNQPMVASSTAGYMTAIQAALNRTTPGYGGDGPETDIEALYQLVTGLGFDGNNNGTVTGSGAAGLGSTQLIPGNSGDVPSFASFTADVSANVLPAAGTIGGAGFRAGALPVILLATDIGFAYQPKGETSVTGANGLTLPVSALTGTSRPSTPFSAGAGLQETITGLNALGALVIGLGTNTQANVDPRQGLEAISKLTGAINRTTTTIANGTVDPIAPGDPLYFQISSGFAGSVTDGVINAIQNAVTNVAMNITVQASDPRVRIINHTGTKNGVGSGQTATFDIEFIGDGIPHRFDLQFVREGTNVVLGSIPVVLGTPIPGDGYHFDDLSEGEIELEDHFVDSKSTTTQNLVVSSPAVSVTEGATNFFTVKLSVQPTSDVTVTVAKTSGDNDLSGAATLTFTSANWDTPQTVTLSAAEDVDLTNGSAVFSVTSSGLTTVNVTGTEADNDTANTAPVVSISSTATDGFVGVRGQIRLRFRLPTLRLISLPGSITPSTGVTVRRKPSQAAPML